MADIKIENINKFYGDVQVIEEVSLEIKSESFAVLVGPSGCGKSTLTKLISGLLQPDEGEVYLSGEKITTPRPTVGMAFQNPVLLEWRSIIKNVMLPLEIVPNKLNLQQKEQRAKQLLSLVGLEGFEEKRPSELSGGMRQRASLCRALVHKPEVLILDEPFGALDAFTREDLWQVMHNLRKEEPFTGILITHDLRESIFLADEVIVLSGRPASKQFFVKLPKSKIPKLDSLYTSKSIDMLKTLRKQIEIAQSQQEQNK